MFPFRSNTNNNTGPVNILPAVGSPVEQRPHANPMDDLNASNWLKKIGLHFAIRYIIGLSKRAFDNSQYVRFVIV